MSISSVSSVALSGLNQAEAKLNSAAQRLSAGPADTVDLSQEAVDLIQAKNEFAVNIKALKISDDIAKDTLKLVP
jgi:flagellar hook protein FlgE